MARVDPYKNFRYLVDIDGITQAGFSEVTIPDVSQDVIEYREGNESVATVRKQPGLIKYGNVILKWGITKTLDLYDWSKLVQQGEIQVARRNMAVIVLDDMRQPVARWEFENAWPVKYDPSDLKASGNEIAIDTIEIAHEGMVRKVK